MSIDKITTPVTNLALINKINEIIEQVNTLSSDIEGVEDLLHEINSGGNNS